MISLAEARTLIAAQAVAVAPQACPLREARGRRLRADIRAAHDLPAFDRSAMDGYAIAAGETAARLRVIGEVQPGAPGDLQLQPGECVRIFTGAPLPRGAGQVLMQETVRREGEWIVPGERSSESHIRYQGEDVRAGELILRAGQRLQPAELALLAFLGQTEPLVSPAPRVLHVATGRELVDPAREPGPGEIRDSNSTLLATLLDSSGARLSHQARCGDELEALLAAIQSEEPETWDLLLISGGASVGDYDFGAAALRALGFAIHFDKINLRPGKPLVFASRGRQMAFVIPGNPVSHFILYHVAIRAALEALEGGPASWPVSWLPLAEGIQEPPCPRETFWPARLELEAGPLVQPLRWQSSGDLTGLIGANALIRIPPQSGFLPAGEKVECLLLA